MKLKDTLRAGARKIVGTAMRVYRASPLYPRCGHMLAKLLGIVTRSATKTVIRQIDGVTFELDMREIIDASLFYSGTFEAEAEKTITAALRPGMIALDIGANFGYHTFRMARAVGNDGKVIAIEPTGWAFGKLQRNISLNCFNNIRPLQVALGDFDHGAREFRFQSSYRLDGTDLSADEIMPMYTLDTLMSMNGVDRVDFVKMDVDGFEGKVIRGAQETLARYHPILFFEITPSAMRANGDDPVELVRTLTGLGYIFQTEARKPIREIGQYLAKVARGFCVNLLAVPLVSERLGGKHQSSRNRVPS
jgi:FkbM family methyltransferase